MAYSPPSATAGRRTAGPGGASAPSARPDGSDPRLASSRPSQAVGDSAAVRAEIVEQATPELSGVDALLALRQAPNEHPLAPLVRWAKNEKERIEKIKDYQGVLVKQENIDGQLKETEHVFIKIRHKPFSAYLYFLLPEGKRGQEAIYVEGQNDNKLIAHGVGFEGAFGTQHLDPNGWLARRGNKYPITDIGMLNLVNKFIEIGQKDIQYGECSVRIEPHAMKLNGRTCTRIQVVHPYPRAQFTFHLANIYIDDELDLPVRYEAYGWPKKPGGKPVLMEAYTYLKLELNKGFTGADFDPNNPNYDF